MMRYTLIALALVVAGCVAKDDKAIDGTWGAKGVKIPDVPPSLNKKAEKLPPLTDNTMGGRELEGARTDAAYNELGIRYNALLNLTKCIQITFNEGTPADMKKCFDEAVK